MRIAQLTYSTKPRGGVVHALALSEALARRGHEVELWTLGRGDDTSFFRPVDPAVTVRVVPFAARDGEDVGARIERSIQVMAAAFDSTATIVHAQDCISANAVFTAGRDCLRTIHHLDEFTTPQLVRCHDSAVRLPIARLCVSRAVAEEVGAGYGLHPTVIPNGVDAARFAAASLAPRSVSGNRCPSSGDNTRPGADEATATRVWRERLGDYVLALGGIEPRKGSLDLLEAFALLRTDHPGLSLVFGGGETLFDYRPYRERFEARAAELDITPIVLGTLADDDVPPLVAAARVLGFVSVKEGFGLAAMEALAAGVPVVARDLPVLREVLGDTVRYADDIPSITAGLDSAVRSGGHDPEPGRRLAFSYSWDAAAAAHELFYRQVLTEGGDRGAAFDLAGAR